MLLKNKEKQRRWQEVSVGAAGAGYLLPTCIHAQVIANQHCRIKSCKFNLAKSCWTNWLFIFHLIKTVRLGRYYTSTYIAHGIGTWFLTPLKFISKGNLASPKHKAEHFEWNLWTQDVRIPIRLGTKCWKMNKLWMRDKKYERRIIQTLSDF